MSRARILEILDRHHARNPIPSGDLIALVGGEELDAWAALEDLVRERQVMTCHIHRPSGDMVVFWPAGKVVDIRTTGRATQARAAVAGARGMKAKAAKAREKGGK